MGLRLAGGVVVAAVLAVIPAVPARGDEPPPRDVVFSHAHGARGTVIVVHGGGFLFGHAEDERPMARRFFRAGYDARSVEYPRCDYRASVRYVLRAVRAARGPVFTVGESAGGTLALEAAVRGLVAGTVTAGAPVDFTRWGKPDYLAFVKITAPRRMSPLFRYGRRSSPVLAFHSPEDEAVPFSQSREIARRGAMLRRITGLHGADRSWVHRARLFFDERARGRAVSRRGAR